MKRVICRQPSVADRIRDEFGELTEHLDDDGSDQSMTDRQNSIHVPESTTDTPVINSSCPCNEK